MATVGATGWHLRGERNGFVGIALLRWAAKVAP